MRATPSEFGKGRSGAPRNACRADPGARPAIGPPRVMGEVVLRGGGYPAAKAFREKASFCS